MTILYVCPKCRKVQKSPIPVKGMSHACPQNGQRQVEMERHTPEVAA